MPILPPSGNPSTSQGGGGTQGPQGPVGPAGSDAPEVIIEFSNDNSTWETTYATGDTYIRFSVDGGTDYTTGVKFVGDDGDDGDDGSSGADGDSVQVQYSTDQTGTYHDTLAHTDKYIRFRIGDSGTWSTGVRFIGDDGDDVEIQYATTQSGSYHDTLVSTDKFIRFRVGDSGTWSTGIQFVGDDGGDGSDGDSVEIQYSSDNSNWHSTLADTDTYIRFRVGSSGTWSTGVQFAGENTLIGDVQTNTSNPFSIDTQSGLDGVSSTVTYNPTNDDNEINIVRLRISGGGSFSGTARLRIILGSGSNDFYVPTVDDNNLRLSSDDDDQEIEYILGRDDEHEDGGWSIALFGTSFTASDYAAMTVTWSPLKEDYLIHTQRLSLLSNNESLVTSSQQSSLDFSASSPLSFTFDKQVRMGELLYLEFDMRFENRDQVIIFPRGLINGFTNLDDFKSDTANASLIPEENEPRIFMRRRWSTDWWYIAADGTNTDFESLHNSNRVGFVFAFTGINNIMTGMIVASFGWSTSSAINLRELTAIVTGRRGEVQ